MIHYTSGMKKIVPLNLLINVHYVIMFGYLAMSYKDSDYTVVIALVCWPKRMNFLVLKLTLGCRIMSAFVFPSTAIARAPRFNIILLIVQLSGKAHKDSAMIAIVHWHLRAKLTLVAKSTVIIFVTFSPQLLAWFEQHGRHMWCALIGTSCRLARPIPG